MGVGTRFRARDADLKTKTLILIETLISRRYVSRRYGFLTLFKDVDQMLHK